MKNHILRLMAMLLMWAALPIFASEPEVPIDEEDVYFLLVGQADDAIKEERYHDAADRLIEAMGVRPESASNVLLLSNLGMVYSYMDKDTVALETLDRAHEMAPSMVTVLDNRARVLFKLGRDEDAYDDFGRIIALDSLNSEARYYHGMIALYNGRADVAAKDFDVLQGNYPDSDRTLVAMASYYSLLRHDKEAIPYYKKLIEKDPSAEFYASLAGCYLATGDLSNASETIADGLQEYPRDPELYYYRAWLNRDRHLQKDARADAQTAIQLGANPARVQALFE